MAGDLGTLLGGLTLLVLGGEFLVRCAARLALQWGVPPLVIGLTVVAFGTSAPELVVSLGAVLEGSPGVAFGNVFGSNFFNLGLILGLCALLQPLSVHVALVRREIPFLVVTSILGAGIAMSGSFGRPAGAALLVLFAGLMVILLRSALRERAELQQEAAPTARDGRLGAGLGVLLGLVLLALGSRLTVTGAMSLASSAGVSEAVIGVTLVAGATSLPELLASAVATLRGQTDIAVGNVVGSNLFNLLMILGTSASVSPIPVPEGGVADAWAAALLALLLLPLAVSDSYRLVRWEGALLLAGYLGYLFWRLA